MGSPAPTEVDSPASTGEEITDECCLCSLRGDQCNLRQVQCRDCMRGQQAVCPGCLPQWACPFCRRADAVQDAPYDTPAPSSDGGASSWEAHRSQRQADSAVEQASGSRTLQSVASDPVVVAAYSVKEFKRNPADLWQWLYTSELLAACRIALADAGYEHILPGKATMFVMPDQYGLVLEHLKGRGVLFQNGERLSFAELNARHFIVGENLRPAFEDKVQSMPRRGKSQVKETRASAPTDVVVISDGSDVEVVEAEPPLAPWLQGFEPLVAPWLQSALGSVARTFIHIPQATSMWSGTTDGPKTVSTTQVKDRYRDGLEGENPRKRRHVETPTTSASLHPSGDSQSLPQTDTQSLSLPRMENLDLDSSL